MIKNQHSESEQLLPIKIFWSSRSPFVRKVMITLHELGLADHVTTIPVNVDGFTQNLELETYNPLGQIPTLVFADNTVLTQADAIIDFLDTNFGDGQLLPSEYPRRTEIMQRASIAHNIMEKAMKRVVATFKLQVFGIEEPGQPEGLDRSLNLTFDALERSVETWADLPLDAGHIGIATALGYSDFRLSPFIPWREGRPKLSAWHATFASRPSYKLTEFSDPSGVFKADKD